jgi:hypothetical protein
MLVSLLCPICGAQIRIIAFITHSADILQNAGPHRGEFSTPEHHPGAVAAAAGRVRCADLRGRRG